MTASGRTQADWLLFDLAVPEELAHEKLGGKSLIGREAELNAGLGHAVVESPTPDHFSFQWHFRVPKEKRQADRRVRWQGVSGHQHEP